MSKENNFELPFSNKAFIDFFQQCQDLPERFQGLFNIQMKNIQSVNRAQQASAENFQDIACRQNEIFFQIMQQTSSMANDMIDSSNPEEKFKRNAVNFQRGYEQTLSNVKEISELIKKSNLETSKILRERTKDSLKEVNVCAREKQA